MILTQQGITLQNYINLFHITDILVCYFGTISYQLSCKEPKNSLDLKLLDRGMFDGTDVSNAKV